MKASWTVAQALSCKVCLLKSLQNRRKQDKAALLHAQAEVVSTCPVAVPF
jgi:hypothetical protein